MEEQLHLHCLADCREAVSIRGLSDSGEALSEAQLGDLHDARYTARHQRGGFHLTRIHYPRDRFLFSKPLHGGRQIDEKKDATHEERVWFAKNSLPIRRQQQKWSVDSFQLAKTQSRTNPH